MASKLRELCGELEDMSVFKDTVGILDVRSRLEPAVDESESEIAALRTRVTEQDRRICYLKDEIGKHRDSWQAADDWAKKLEAALREIASLWERHDPHKAPMDGGPTDLMRANDSYDQRCIARKALEPPAPSDSADGIGRLDRLVMLS